MEKTKKDGTIRLEEKEGVGRSRKHKLHYRRKEGAAASL
jgi:hypothetical protein